MTPGEGAYQKFSKAPARKRGASSRRRFKVRPKSASRKLTVRAR